ncbi:MAG TPA: alanine--tRNA ligase-related protein, partial [Nitrososphaerales archaeon]|nr:alanine--tRNA ligase-related protein [Nitrososphaerales archaeon]
MDESSTRCPEQPCSDYSFLGNPPTGKRFDYVGAWKKVSEFFVKNGHKEISRYPVVCRWRPDLYFTVASIVDFQRVEGNSVVFEFPENPLVVPQMCLRFVDIGNVGVTGRHYSSFCMIGQHALSNKKGYWKDRCIELDYELLTSEFGIPKEEIVFKEDVWLGPGAFGNSLEYYVRGLELGNAVFTGFEGTPANYQEYSEKVVDMGAGLERFVWITQGTASSYDAVFPKVIDKLKDRSEFAEEPEDRENLLKYFRLAGELDVEQFRLGGDSSRNLLAKSGLPPDFDRKLLWLQAIYSIADHLRTLTFAISDGALPSNVGGGYNLRVLYRRAADFAEKIGLGQDLALVAELHVQELRPMYPELSEHVDDIRNILEVEQRKYSITKIRATKIIESLRKKKESVSEHSLIQLYDSDGITPETLLAAGMKMEIPPDFYSRVTERHMIQKKEDGADKSFDLRGLPQTRLLFYEKRDLFEFDAKALRVLNERYLILDMTSFYARSGGQEPDHGTINGCKVVNVIKSNGIILHELSNFDSSITIGATLHGVVDSKRRGLIMRHHTATHVLNAAARKVLGSWVWQHS